MEWGTAGEDRRSEEPETEPEPERGAAGQKPEGTDTGELIPETRRTWKAQDPAAV